ncbi:hypothetical protein [Streptomyces sp. CBMA156]|uniref:hypothetical protein n=1 Tax=Streptomyces sp. CBMA156 TaxID=1930280 RepID=UPI001661E1D2|nr:hypothetical protein [Streptomyces sp. CBMA156]MBD0675639.1 hypothetical protein [Streptomyces sp. CBMA156]
MPAPVPHCLADVHCLPVAGLAALDPGTVADPGQLVSDAWLAPVTDLARSLLDSAPGEFATTSYTAAGHTTLLLATPADGHPAWYLRLPDGTPTDPRPATRPTAVLPLTGALDLALYRDRDDVQGDRPQYLRALNPGQLCLLHRGATVRFTGAEDGVQLIPTQLPLDDADPVPLTREAYRAAVEAARARLADPAPNAAATPGAWPSEIPDLRTAGLSQIHAQAGALHRLAAARDLLTYLAHTAVMDPERYEASRATLFLDRLVLSRVDECGFEIRLNTDFRPDGQRLPHSHAYPFAARVLAGGHLHTVHLPTDTGEGPFTSTDTLPAVTTTELPGSTYTLAPTLVHRSVMLPGTTTLMLRGPHAATDLIPPASHWPAPVDGDAPVHSRRLTDTEHRRLIAGLTAAGVIDHLPTFR